MPSKKYAMGPEIHEHTQRIAKHFDLYKHALFHTAVTAVSWEDDKKRWRVKTSRGDDYTSKYLCIGNGPLSVAQLPDIPGIETFKGKHFHTSRWDYGYTGGDRNGAAMTGLKDKRVAIIGTGATAVQCVPELAKYCKELLVFQRTPSAVDIRGNHEIDPEWFKQISSVPGWQQRWLDNFTAIWGQINGNPAEVAKEYGDLVQDGWSELALRVRDVFRSIPPAEFTMEKLMAAMEASDNKTTSRIRARVDEVVTEDPVAAKGLKAWYRQGCKRPTFHDEYLQCFNRPNVTLIDTDGQGVDRITETGLHACGKEYEADLIIYASGFEYINTSYAERLGFEVEGPQETITDAWSQGMRTLHGLQVHGFPNLFLIQLSQAGLLASNVPHNFVESARVVAGLVKYMEDNSKDTVEPSLEAQNAWVKTLLDGGRQRANPECTPGYYNNEGEIREEFKNLTGYPAGATAYFKLMRDWTDNGVGTGEFAGVNMA
jgi:cyclohexanone monooxygenase